MSIFMTRAKRFLMTNMAKLNVTDFDILQFQLCCLWIIVIGLLFYLS